MEITKREILVSVTIIAVMMLLGFVVVGRIDAWQIQKNAEYYTALQITSTEQFRYGMVTGVGNAFVYGNLQAVDPVTYPEIGSEYLYVKKDEEHYNMHTRTVTETDSHGERHTRTETYWTWDHVRSEELHSQKIRFLGIEMDYGKIQMPDEKYIDTIRKSKRVRFNYYGVPAENVGTVYTDLRDNTMADNSRFWPDADIDTVLKYKTCSKTGLFWLVWIMLTVGIVWRFYYLDNDWLNGG